MRATLTVLLLALLATVGISACAKSSSSTSSTTNQTAATTTAPADDTPTGNAISTDNTAVSEPAPGASGTPPVYPGATPGVRPEGVGMKAPPPQVKAYSTPDEFATVKAWYKAHLKGSSEIAQPGMEKTEDAFLVGKGASGMVVLIQSFKGKTWILIGPPM